MLLNENLANLDTIGAVVAEGYVGPYGENYVDPREWMTDNWGNPVSPSLVYNSREDGRNRPFVETERDIGNIRGLARLMTATNPYAQGLVNTLSNYVIGDGFTYQVGQKKRRSYSAINNEQVIFALQDFIDDFVEKNNWDAEFQIEQCVRAFTDGEVPLRLHDTGDQIPTVRIVEPEYIVAPVAGVAKIYEDHLENFYPRAGASNGPYSWEFGVQTPDGDTESVLGYYIQWDNGTGDDEYVPVWEMEHIKRNVPRNVKRGLSDFFSVNVVLQDAMKLLTNISKGASVQAAIALYREWPAGTTSSGISTMNSNNAEYSENRTTPSGTRSVQVQRMEPGGIVDGSTGAKITLGAMGSPQGPLFLDVLQGSLRAIGARWSMPEFMVSGDASNANYSSTLVSESPFTKNIQSTQAAIGSRHVSLLWKAVRMAHARGYFQNHVGDMSVADLKRIAQITAEPADVETRDRDKETTRRLALMSAGIMSPKTVAVQESLDYEVEQANIAENTTESTGVAEPDDLAPAAESLYELVNTAFDESGA